jgi:hypothetical protein
MLKYYIYSFASLCLAMGSSTSLVIVNIFLLLYIFTTYFLAFGKANHEYARMFIVING